GLHRDAYVRNGAQREGAGRIGAGRYATAAAVRGDVDRPELARRQTGDAAADHAAALEGDGERRRLRQRDVALGGGGEAVLADLQVVARLGQPFEDERAV